MDEVVLDLFGNQPELLEPFDMKTGSEVALRARF
jgi:hypothetical protein